MHVCVDITGESSMVGFGNIHFEVCQAARCATTVNEDKHGATCKANQHGFIPFAFDTFRFLASEALELFKRVHKVVIDSNVMTTSSNEYVFRRISFAIQKGLEA
ncbi:hypothetical protein FRX31_020965 [Thalictrum thalictroides]|uniref:Uncharacterized protein n=1 Tax=Thalictrum thalictroides TaxID=46969 RepID=A0A7J6VXZ1_THATH|nr:hypothetical protein FRX31_020965 [Thalictrum thalictroides]